MHIHINDNLIFKIVLFFVATFETVGNSLSTAESGVFDENETKVLFICVAGLNDGCHLHKIEKAHWCQQI